MSRADSSNKKMKGILTDVTKCIGCERCVEACVQANRLPVDTPAHFKAGDGLSGNRFTAIVKTPGKDATQMVRRQCMHCLEPSCQAACLVGALEKRPDGPVVYHQEKCIGCRYCMLACPFLIPRYEYDQPLPYIRKCRMDEQCRVDGGMPACTSACPTGATVFGPRETLIKEARRRIAAEPDKYINHIYGEEEFGGTSVIYIADSPLNEVLKMPTAEDFKKLAVPSLARDSIPHLNHKWVLVTPFQFLTVGAGLFGAWFLRRRSRIMHEESSQNESSQDKSTQGHANGGEE